MAPRNRHRAAGFGEVSEAELDAADLFFEELAGRAEARPRWPPAEATSPSCPDPPPVPTACLGLPTEHAIDCFDYDSAKVLPRHRAYIVNIAHCLVHAKASGSPLGTLELVGHADPSGDEGYNERLGERRAKAVKKAIQQEIRRITGKSWTPTITVKTEGERSPITGDDARSRRVVVKLAKAHPRPPRLPACSCNLGVEGEALRNELADSVKKAIGVSSPYSGSTGPTKVFETNYDYHSSVHAHWALLEQARLSGDASNRAFVIGRLTAKVIADEHAFLTTAANSSFELPYGRVWMLMLLRELEQHTERDLPEVHAMRVALEKEVIAWLERHKARPATDPKTVGWHDSWPFAFLMLHLSKPLLPSTRAKMKTLYDNEVKANRAAWRAYPHVPSTGEFLHVPSIIDTIDILRGQPAQVTASNIAASGIAGIGTTGGHTVGAEMTRLWPVALLARTDPAMCTILRDRLAEWRRHPEHWKFDPHGTTRFRNNTHWTPQFLWMAVRLRC